MAPPPSATASAAQSLFSSLLAPPPAKRARTIHNPDDPPAVASGKAVEQTRSPQRRAKATRTPDAHGKSKANKHAKEKTAQTSSGKGKGKGKQRVTAEGSFESAGAGDRDIDMEAAATLTTILLNQQRPSMSATAGSPRSSISAGSDPGSVHSFAHYAQSSTRTAAGDTPARTASQHSLFARAARSTATPPHSPAASQASPALSHTRARRPSVSQGSGLRPEGAGTPKMTPRDRVGSRDDTDAADMLLLMATSPSPARPTTTRDRDARDAAAFRALRGGSSSLKGRVLFPSFGSDDGGTGARAPRMLSRETSGSFASVSSTATEPVSPRTLPASAVKRELVPSHLPSKLSTVRDASGSQLGVPMLPTVTPPTPVDQNPSQLLPPVYPPSQQCAAPSRQPSDSHNGPTHKALPDPHTPNASFSLSDYMNISPSPAVAMNAPAVLHPQAGRRLFEDHHTLNGDHSSLPPDSSSPSSPSRLGRGAGRGLT